MREETGPPMVEFWESVFTEKQMMWGVEPTRAAVLASDDFAARGVKRVLIPGVGYGRNAAPFLERGMSVTGIEISGTAIALARSALGLDFIIHHGPVANMPYDRRQYEGVFCHGLIHLLDEGGRAKLIRDAHAALAPGGRMIFTTISKKAPMYGQGARLGDDRYEVFPGVQMYFHDADSVQRDFAPHGLVELSEIDEPGPSGRSLPFINVICRKGRHPR